MSILVMADGIFMNLALVFRIHKYLTRSRFDPVPTFCSKNINRKDIYEIGDPRRS